MSTIDNGGPAFPMQDQQAIHAWAQARIEMMRLDTTAERDAAYIQARAEAIGGMSLRDYMASKALPAVYAEAMEDARKGSGLFKYPEWRYGLALDAYLMADAMLRARKEGGAS